MTSEPDHARQGEFDRAVALAGFLAERGVSSLLHQTDSAWVEINARSTDLPRLVVELAEGRAIKSEKPPRFRLWRAGGRLHVESEDSELIRAFGA
ncbi:MAG: hypothetical protein U0638_15500 [Phycisphaerales bacterium]